MPNIFSEAVPFSVSYARTEPQSHLDGQYIAIIDKYEKPWSIKSATGPASKFQELPEIGWLKLCEIFNGSLSKGIVKVRILLSPHVKLLWTGIRVHDLSIPITVKKTHIPYKLANSGGVFSNCDGKRSVIHQTGGESLSVCASTNSSGEDCASPDVCGYDSGDLETVKKALFIV
ncbi:uncharacterized protein LY79DRAFT_668265 [Colletotrichum navitas]|uniref:Uncharacterized protein n=1 Tax=Colletotrichum navitas TaxID=681940 RepID=A0AAD8Q346_9PEZI|nr:uncharacterized protein LY79DRAFT_668265 [Colletotrichum navitas]KAK1595051.1 hypothetical protein LY79DRAFT_668265 [Colletotrichum navitas]